MGKLRIKKIAAATLVETIVSLVVILAVFAIATTIVAQVTSSGSSLTTMKAKATLREYALKTREQKAFFDEKVAVEGFVLNRMLSSYKESTQLQEIHYYIYDDHHNLLDDWQEVILIE